MSQTCVARVRVSEELATIRSTIIQSAVRTATPHHTLTLRISGNQLLKERIVRILALKETDEEMASVMQR